MQRIAHFKPTHPGDPPLHASDRKKEKGRRTEEAANDERNGKKEQENTKGTLVRELARWYNQVRKTTQSKRQRGQPDERT